MATTGTMVRNALGRGLVALGLWLGVATASQATETVVYYHTDALGSPVAMTDSGGTVIEHRTYEPYGKQLSPLPPQDGPGYTGHVYDAATGLNYMQQRYYDPGIGLFLSVDPVTADSGTGANFNRYRYANNNPYRFTDPDGRRSKEEHEHKKEIAQERQEDEAQANRDQVASREAIQPVYPEAILVPAIRLVRTLTAAAEAVAAPATTVTVSASRHPESAAHIRDAQAAGQPRVLTINRSGAAENRRAALGGSPRQAGKDRDEYPPAMFSEGGAGSSVRSISPSDNRGAGACIGAQCRGLPNGTRVEIRVSE